MYEGGRQQCRGVVIGGKCQRVNMVLGFNLIFWYIHVLNSFQMRLTPRNRGSTTKAEAKDTTAAGQTQQPSFLLLSHIGLKLMSTQQWIFDLHYCCFSFLVTPISKHCIIF